MGGDDEEERERKALKQYLAKRRLTCIAEFKKLIAKMKERGIQEVLCTDHPSYDLALTPCDHFPPLEEGQERLGRVTPGDRSFEGYCWDETTWPWFCDCWSSAGGPESGCRVLLFANGMGDMIDLTTREPPPEESIRVGREDSPKSGGETGGKPPPKSPLLPDSE
uniref:Uncharacterized protein n=1 Tax=Chromera velia CCMP2878 TaxID=1169474 RepID=A0A0G4HUV2_9ALVE|eukprot:Cvel_32049.t1-p1 / transcript=Cvel_32049.t1 / gene=Cvel_32049 / organism=Chromera_velia_CCMP2878 / gene_product=hypothetical protein / transcript_product=hypothetical protein / location=Cvel_scaffold4894:2924-3415(-) / protein_length=164 / sequence_SO=supercontig / SO=protein_coding / is_pseudo=false